MSPFFTARLLRTGRVAALERAFDQVARTRMAGLPLLHPRLRVEALGFRHVDDAEAGGGLAGILIAPWFMNLVWLPDEGEAAPLPVGASRTRRVGCEAFDFIGAEADGFGRFEACSLWSPMTAFEDQGGARATAQAVLDLLWQPQPEPARRGFLLGRRAAEAAR